MHDRLGCWVAYVNQEINIYVMENQEKWALHVYGDNHRIIEINIRGALCVGGHISVLLLLE
jgi:hypothetical protein